MKHQYPQITGKRFTETCGKRKGWGGLHSSAVLYIYYYYILYYTILYYTIYMVFKKYKLHSKNIKCPNIQLGEKNYASPIRFFLLQQSENLNSNIRVTNCEWLPGYRRWLIVKAFSLLPRFSHIGKWFVSPFPVKMSDIILYISQPLQVP